MQAIDDDKISLVFDFRPNDLNGGLKDQLEEYYKQQLSVKTLIESLKAQMPHNDTEEVWPVTKLTL